MQHPGAMGRNTSSFSLLAEDKEATACCSPKVCTNRSCRNSGSHLTTRTQLRVHPIARLARELFEPIHQPSLQTSPCKWAVAAFQTQMPEVPCPKDLHLPRILPSETQKSCCESICSPRGNRSCQNCLQGKHACSHFAGLYSFLSSHCSFGHCSAPTCLLCQQLKGRHR